VVPAKPGPRGGHKLTGEILTWAEQQLAADPGLRAASLAGPIAEAGPVTTELVHALAGLAVAPAGT
jgi:hypothetical protein